MRHAYEGVEAEANFPDQAALDHYRGMALQKSEAQAAFIRRHFPEARSLVEPCCGNGRLLMALAADMTRLEGFDIAESRVDFARRWIADRHHDHISVWQDDLLQPQHRVADPADLAVCITGAFCYFEAIAADGGRAAAQAIASMVRPGGGLLLELYRHPRTVAHCSMEPDGTWQRWSELPADDPFRFSLSAFRFDAANRVLHHDKTFVHRDGPIDEGRSEAIRIYDAEDVGALLRPWFSDIRFHDGWNDAPLTEETSQMVVTARRRG
ncbi:MAG: class I SAM-dependent methyltransferase [Kiloniellales bacterium]